MVTNPSDADTQISLAAILRYRGSGDFAAFCHAADLANDHSVSDQPYFCANLLLACQVTGMVEVSNATGAIEWWVAHSGDICIHAAWIKTIGISKAWFEANEASVMPVVTDQTGRALLLGTARKSTGAEGSASVFARPIDKIIPRFKDIENQLFVEAPYETDPVHPIEIFNPKSHQWENPGNNDKASRLIRVRTDYAGILYFIQHPQLRLQFRITQPEWAYVVAFHTLPWKLTDLVELRDGQVAIHRTIRLPILMYRALFSASATMAIGPILRFQRVSDDCLRGFQQYFGAVGDRS